MNRNEVPLLQEPDPRDKRAFLGVVVIVSLVLYFWFHTSLFFGLFILLFSWQMADRIGGIRLTPVLDDEPPVTTRNQLMDMSVIIDAVQERELATMQTTSTGRPIPPGHQACPECYGGYNRRGDGKHTGDPCWKCGGLGYVPS